MTQKILICGFPHCGTSILKSILGHIENVEEIEYECTSINKHTDKPYIIAKSPFTKKEFFGEKYKDYIKIFIIRNPVFVFSSLNKRFEYNIPKYTSFDIYLDTIKKFINLRTYVKKNIYTIRYEDLFENNFYALRKIISDIGIPYDDNIFDNTRYRNVIIPNTKLLDTKPKNIQHGLYRTWQINQPFVSNNDISKIDLSDIQTKQIVNNPYVLQVYPDIHV